MLNWFNKKSYASPSNEKNENTDKTENTGLANKFMQGFKQSQNEQKGLLPTNATGVLSSKYGTGQQQLHQESGNKMKNGK